MRHQSLQLRNYGFVARGFRKQVTLEALRLGNLATQQMDRL